MPECKILTLPESPKRTEEDVSARHAAELDQGERFAFGRNWS
ncbi:MAG: hypothetical protein ACE5H3_11335 [Planctomycetota bacterium]